MHNFYLTYGHDFTRRSQVPQSFLVAHDPESTDDSSQIESFNNKVAGPTGYALLLNEYSDDLKIMHIQNSRLVT